jgi:phosphoribosylformylglycinamidine synthase PurS subunit
MNFKVEVTVMPLDAILDPQGKAVESGLKNMGINGVSNVRIGKCIRFALQASSKDEAELITKNTCEKLLHNPVMEQYSFVVTEA